MNININKTGDSATITIEGIIKSVSDSQAIKDAVNSCGDAKFIQIDITESFSVTSSVIGFLLKKKQADKVDISIKVNDNRLYDLFQSLNLIDVLSRAAGKKKAGTGGDAFVPIVLQVKAAFKGEKIDNGVSLPLSVVDKDAKSRISAVAKIKKTLTKKIS